MRNLKLTLEYEGTEYHGWQIQPGLRTIQGVLEEAVGRIAGSPVRVTGAARTDAGVHALGQVVNFRGDVPLDRPRLRQALNSLLPRDIAVTEVQEVPADFHARRDARAKTYRYSLLPRDYPSAHLRNFALYTRHPLDGAAMERAAVFLVGRHDFSSFRSAHCAAPHPVREVLEARFVRRGDLLDFEITANAFLQHMVRILMGTLLLVGRGALTPEGFREILEAKDRRRAAKTIEARGLCLVRIHY